MSALIVRWLLNELKVVGTLIDSSETAEKSRVAAIKAEAAEKFESCYQHFVYIKENRTLLSAQYYNDHPELVVTVAELAFKTEYYDRARSVVEDFFDDGSHRGAFYCRAKCLMGLILDYEARKCNGTESVRRRKIALKEIIEAVDIALTTKNMQAKYAFTVYNCSLAAWRIVKPFVRMTRGKHFVAEVSKISSALETVDDEDKVWRLKFLSAAALCYTDAGNAKDASDALDKAIVHAEGLLNITLDNEKEMMVDVDECKSKSEELMKAIREIEEREEQLCKPPRIDPDLPVGEQELPLPEFPPLEGLASEDIGDLRERLNVAQSQKATAESKMKDNNDTKDKEEDTLCKLYMQRVHSNPGDAKKIQGLPLVTGSPRMRTLVNLQCMVTGAIPDKDWESTFNNILTDLEAQPQNAYVIETILDACRIASRLKLLETSKKLCEVAEKATTTSTSIRVKLDFIKAVQMVSDLEQESAHQSIGQRLSDKEVEGFAINRRLEALKLLERTLSMCTNSMDDGPLVEEMSVAIWNLSLPLLTAHLRHHVHSVFGIVAGALEEIPSSMVELRASIHLELSKCEEAADFVGKAKEEATKALLCDYGVMDGNDMDEHLDKNRNLDHLIKPFLDVLRLRDDVYGQPEDVESQVSLLIQQAKESTSKSFSIDTTLSAGKMMLEMLFDEQKAKVKAAAAEGGEGGAEEEKGEGGEEVPAVLNQFGSVIPMSLQGIEAILSVNYASPASGLESFTRLAQQRSLIMAMLCKLSHSQRANIPLTEHLACYALSSVWDYKDPFLKHLIDAQIDMYFCLADCLVDRLSGMYITDEQERQMATDEENSDREIPNPRTLGIASPYCTEEMNLIKRLVVVCVTKSVELAHLVNDTYGLQNAITYFYNLHLPVFRNKWYHVVSEEVRAFLKQASEVIAQFPVDTIDAAGKPNRFDGKLKVSVSEALALSLEAVGEMPAAIDVASKGAQDGTVSVFDRRTLAGEAGRLIAVNAAGGKPADPPKFDDAFLNVYAFLAQADLPEAIVPKDVLAGIVDKAFDISSTDVEKFLEEQDWAELSKDKFNELTEMRAELWTRMTRLKIVLADVYGAQACAEKVLTLVEQEAMGDQDKKKLSPRVWRWLCVCERYFGLAIQEIIEPEGMDKSLQEELNLAGLRHFYLACTHALRSTRDDILIEAAICAWNACLRLTEATGEARHSLLGLQRQIIDTLLECTDKGDTMMLLRQQFYLSMIEGTAVNNEWDGVLDLVFESFDNVPVRLQKPLWRWRVIVLSKKGKNVLDGIQKMKEGDNSLQAKVYATLARASTNPKQQIEAYQKTIEILNEDIERVDYELETAQWMASAGVPRVEIREVVQSALDAIYEVEEKLLVDNNDIAAEGADVDAQSSHSAHSGTSRGSKGSRRSTAPGKGKPGTSGSRRGSRASGRATGQSKKASRASSRASSALEEEDESGMPTDLKIKHLEQGTRTLVMLAMLSSSETEREDRATEAVYFIQRFFELWQSTVVEAARCDAYYAQTSDERDATPIEQYVAPEEVTAGLAMPLKDPVAMLRWIPGEGFDKAMEAARLEFGAHNVPSPATLQNVPLTFHYSLWLASTLESFGFSKHALLVLSWCRAVLLYVEADNTEYALAVIHMRSVVLLKRCGLADLVESLPQTLGKSGVAPTDLIARFGAKVTVPGGSPAEASPSESLSVFGFYSWTQAMDCIDVSVCGLEMCQDLVYLGQNAQCQAIASLAQRDFTLKQNVRGYLRAVSVLSELQLASGSVGDALTSVLQVQEQMSVHGDAKELSRQVLVAMGAYVLLVRSDEAKRVALDAIATLALYANFAVSKQDQGNESRAGTATLSRSSKQGGVRSVQQTESSLEVVMPLRDVVLAYVDLLLIDAREQAAQGKDLRPLYTEMCSHFDKLYELATAVSGPGSYLVASISEKRSTAVFSFLCLYHAKGSSAGMPTDEYRGWLEEQLQTCIEQIDQCIDIRRGLLARVTYEDSTYLPLEMPKKEEEEVSDPKAKKGKKGKDPESEEAKPTGPEMRQLSIPLARETAFAELEMARQSMFLARMKGDQLSGLPEEPATEPSVIEKFLSDTQQPLAFQKRDFESAAIHKAGILASSASQILVNTDHAVVGKMLHAQSIVMRLCGSGTFDRAWRAKKVTPPPAAEEGADAAPADAVAEEEEEVFVFPESAVDARSNLMKHTVAAIQARRFDISVQPAVALIDAYGKYMDGGAYSCAWVMQLQSMAASEWLNSVLTSSLNPKSQTYASLLRLAALEAGRQPTKESQPQIAAELEFLDKTSASWRRLSVASDPAEIVGKLPAKTVVICIQACPSNTAIFCAVGLPGAVEGEPEVYKCPGQWQLDKMELSEGNRRLLIGMVQQHDKWAEDAAKFVAVYGENVSADQDLIGVEGRSGGKLAKSERALEERLRAQRSDLEQVFEPLLGPESESFAFLQKLLGESEEELGAVLLIDPALQALPWEGLPSVASLFNGRVSRDFSLQLLGHRLDTFGADAKAEASALRTMFDPYGDDLGSKIEGFERQSITEVVASLEGPEVGVRGVAKWAPVKGGEGVFSLTDWVAATQSAPKPLSVFVYSPGRLGALLNPIDVASMDFSKVALFLSSDQGLSDASFRRQNSLDNSKKPSEIAMEDPLRLAALLSLGGCGNVTGSMWSTTLAAQKRYVQKFWGTFGQGAQSVQAALSQANVLKGEAPEEEGKAPEGVPTLKPWIYLARVSFGIPSIEYAET